jgi:membrane fusion protein (multidrug efflux system)
VSGLAGSAAKVVGDFVSPSTVLVNVSSISPVRIRFSISNADFLRLFDADCEKAARTAKITLALADGRAFPETGQIEYAENAVDSATDSIRMYALFQNSGKAIRPGSSVTVEMEVSDEGKAE